MCTKMTCNKIIIGIIVVIALVLAILVSIWHQQGLAYIIFVSRFFDVMLPVLAVGALLKYLLCGCCHKHNSPEEKSECCKKD